MDSLASADAGEADRHAHPVSARNRLLCLLRGHLPHRLRAFVDGRTVSTCTRCGARVRRGKNMRWEPAP